jgi:NAD(P)-dependent dehydrogenase (short-subunit alcohol dehydrogenase family)
MISTRVAVVTGAARGIGFDTAKWLTEHGYTVVLGARDGNKAAETSRRVAQDGKQVFPVQLDVTKPEEIDAVHRLVEGSLGRIDALINNAAAWFEDDTVPTQTNLALVEEAFQVSCLGAWRMCQAFTPMMKAAGYGRIVNVSAGAGSFEDGRPSTRPWHAIAKVSLNMFTRLLADELAGTGVLVNAVCPWSTGNGSIEPMGTGADTIVWAATLPQDGPTGSFLRYRQPIRW